jgi:hypothetical protein
MESSNKTLLNCVGKDVISMQLTERKNAYDIFTRLDAHAKELEAAQTFKIPLRQEAEN